MIKVIFLRAKRCLVEKASLLKATLRLLWAEAKARITDPDYDCQRGAMNTNILMTFFFAIIIIVALITYLWQEGLPQILTATSNTTALTAAGATTSQLNWITMIGGLVFLVIILGLLQYVFGIFGGGGGKGGGKRWRRKRR